MGGVVFPLPRFKGRPPVVSSGFGPRKGTPTHKGSDITYRAEDGDPPYPGKGYTATRTPAYYSPPGMPVLAYDDGVVVQSAMKPSIGGDVWVHHKVTGLVTRYAHLETLAVKVGDQVVAGQQLGVWGAGSGTPFVHLHFQVLRAGQKNSQMDPRAFLGVAEMRDGPTRGPIRGPVTLVDVKRPMVPGGTSWLLFLVLLVALKRN